MLGYSFIELAGYPADGPFMTDIGSTEASRRHSSKETAGFNNYGPPTHPRCLDGGRNACRCAAENTDL
jgi:hypothetical protein